MQNLDQHLKGAIQQFWAVRGEQAEHQGEKTGKKDAGLRTAVTGGKHFDGFIKLCRDLLIEAGLPEATVFWNRKRELPGYFRAEKNWDLLAVANGRLLAVIEFKALGGPSFGNNLNNRAEEALGNATDLLAAFRQGAFKPAKRPWLGYVFILEECEKSLAPVKVKEPHFSVFPEFRGASYAKRAEILLIKLLRERLYDGVGLILSTQAGGLKGEYHTPCEELGFQNFVAGLEGQARAFANMK